MLIWDLEADGFLEEATKIYCLCGEVLGTGELVTITDNFEVEVPKLFSQHSVIAGHFIFGYDLPLLNKLIGLEWDYESVNGNRTKIIDTLALSHGSYPDRSIPKGCKGAHGLEPWGVRTGVPKPPVQDWKNVTIEQALHRCREDVQINKNAYSEIMAEINNYSRVCE